ncbi:hypothetical protein So717_41120 [Roseobacter cerasinus]|uniref:Uncharacterized protein n=1 Tax=Roseobacter cerasinus TaxID=2602289 RepID=A0A640VWF2_9RHOB|nr:hypothetical protein [Roseobacter cerasinus]GFE52359.1 hypothetical protein So717_41120 [Roseobacter cerasinus]
MAHIAFEQRPRVERAPLRVLLALAAGVLVGLMLAEVRTDVDFKSALTTAPIAGEDWHGNVRRSAP